jgi:predicted MFS family arabinose efflux permease
MSFDLLRPRLAPSTALALVVFAFTVTMLGTTLPTPLYPALENEFGFGELTTTVLFAVYPVGVTTALLVCGHWSDQIGRKPMLQAGLLFSALSAIAFLLPAWLGWVYVARVLSGFSAGIFTGTATAAIVDFAADDAQSMAGLVAAAANMGGLGLGPLVAGLFAQWAPHPLILPFLVDLFLVVAASGCVLLVPEPIHAAAQPHLRPQRIHVPRAIRPLFVRAAMAGFAGFAVLGLFGAVSPAFLGEVLRQTSTLLTGTVVASVFVASITGQVVSLRLGTSRGMIVGCVALLAGMVLLGSSLLLGSLALLITGGLVAGAGQGLSFRAGLGSVTTASPPDQRSRIASALFIALYVGISLPVVGEGAAATAFGLVPAGVIFVVLVGLLAVTVLILLGRAHSDDAHHEAGGR